MTPEVAQRLGEITVDVKTVERPKRVSAATAPPRPPKGSFQRPGMPALPSTIFIVEAASSSLEKGR